MGLHAAEGQGELPSPRGVGWGKAAELRLLRDEFGAAGRVGGWRGGRGDSGDDVAVLTELTEGLMHSVLL